MKYTIRQLKLSDESMMRLLDAVEQGLIKTAPCMGDYAEHYCAPQAVEGERDTASESA
jgi:hypothetical protein